MTAPDTAGRFYRPELDVVRFLAFLLVFLYHSLPNAADSRAVNLPKGAAHSLYAAFASAAGYGLCLFFTLSAYLICELLLRERDATNTIQAKQFYIRRILRIWPLYFAGLTIALVIAFLPGGDRSAINWVGWAAVLLGNWFLIFHGPIFTPMEPLWSISVEEQFYLFAPWVIKRLNRRSLCGFAIILIFLANICLGLFSDVLGYDLAVWRNSFVQFENFAAGILLCLVLHGRSPKVSAWLRIALLAASALCWYLAQSAQRAHRSSLLLMEAYGLIALGCCCLLVAFIGLDRRFLPEWAIYFGRISYGLYVFHGLALHLVVSVFPHYTSLGSVSMLLKGAAAMGLTILFASLSYRYFETPFLRMKKRHEVIESRPV